MNRRPTPQLDSFAEHMANGLTPHQAAARMGIAPSTGDKMLQRLRKVMGAQAV